MSFNLINILLHHLLQVYFFQITFYRKLRTMVNTEATTCNVIFLFLTVPNLKNFSLTDLHGKLLSSYNWELCVLIFIEHRL